MRALMAIVLVPFVAACEAQPAPTPEPVLPNPVLATTEVDRRAHLEDRARKGDFRITFGEPFVTFENRGSRLAISQPNSDPGYVVIDTVRATPGQGTVTFTGTSTAIDAQEPFVLTVEEGACQNRFSGERTRHIAYLGSREEPRRLRTCASRAF